MSDLKIGRGLTPIQQHGFIPTRPLVLGAPAKPIRPLNEKDLEMIKDTLQDYQDLKKIYQFFSSHKAS